MDSTPVHRLTENLEHRLGKGRVFIDYDDIGAGEEFWDVIRRSIVGAQVFLATIGPRWNENKNLDDPNSYVRREIELALELRSKGRLVVMPVLVDGAEISQVSELPRSIQPLLQLNALSIEKDRLYDYSVELLVKEIEFAIKKRGEGSPESSSHTRYVLVSGSGTGDTPQLALETANLLGRRLATGGYNLVTCGWPGVDRTVMESFMSHLSPTEDVSKRLWAISFDGDNHLQELELTRARIHKDVDEKSAWRHSVRLADTVVLIGGLGGTYQTARWALQRKIAVLPIPSTSTSGHWAAERVFREMLRDWRLNLNGIPYVDFKKLNEPTPTVLDNVMAILSELPLGNESKVSAEPARLARLLSLPERCHLLNLADEGEHHYKNSASLRFELRRLSAFELIRSERPLNSLPKNFALSQILKLTPEGTAVAQVLQHSDGKILPLGAVSTPREESHLRTLSRGYYRNNQETIDELRSLRSFGLIEQKAVDGVTKIRELPGRFDLNDFFAVTASGREFLKLQDATRRAEEFLVSEGAEHLSKAPGLPMAELRVLLADSSAARRLVAYVQLRNAPNVELLVELLSCLKTEKDEALKNGNSRPLEMLLRALLSTSSQAVERRLLTLQRAMLQDLRDTLLKDEIFRARSELSELFEVLLKPDRRSL